MTLSGRIISMAAAITLSFSFSSVLSCSAESAVYRTVEFRDFQKRKNLEEVVKGVDISSIISLENSGVIFRDRKGNSKDIFLTLKEAGVNYIRVRVWNDPYDENGNTYGGGDTDIRNAVKIAERCAKYDLKLMVDFHYSDFWADPSAQREPKAWRGMSLEQKAEALRNFTSDSLKKIAETGVQIGIVQVGNETLGGMAGEEDWTKTPVLMKAGAEAIRAFDRDILIAVHFPDPSIDGNFKWVSGILDKSGLDYDIFASSYYPFWHGSLGNLTAQLQYVANTYGKYVMVAETSWASSLEDFDFSSNTVSDSTPLNDGAKYTVDEQGQIDSVLDVFQAVADVGSKGIGVCYWEPAWISVGDSYEHNKVLWEKYGSGASTVAEGSYSGWEGMTSGSAVDNQALFDQQGRPLKSLYLFSHVNDSDNENLILNGDFEGYDSWSVLNTTSGKDSKFEINGEQVRNGKNAMHWYSPNDFKESRVTKTVRVMKDGHYIFTGYLSGERASYVSDIYVNDRWVGKDTGEVRNYEYWNKVRVEFDAKAGDDIKIEFIVNGWDDSYGSIDDCSLFFSDRKAEEFENMPHELPGHELKGDTDGNGSINSADLVKLIRYLTDSDHDAFEHKNADMNEDGKTDVLDLILLKELLLSQ